MKYFIQTDTLQQVSEGAYEVWYEIESDRYSLPGYSRLIGDYRHSIETLYVGAFDDFEEPLPFCLFYFRDRMIDGRKNRWTNEINDTEQFGSFEELKKRYDYLVRKIE